MLRRILGWFELTTAAALSCWLIYCLATGYLPVPAWQIPIGLLYIIAAFYTGLRWIKGRSD